jgi:O-acetylhomoserine/O-acetylserine sulfhydrylase-like pyridoxal-dependent enzyme
MQHSLEIWVANAFNAWQKYKKLNTLMLIANLHTSELKQLVNYLSKTLLQIVTKNGE